MTSGSDQLGLVGTTVADKYAVESVVGQGGFATVYRATHKLWQRPVALKVFSGLTEVREDARKQLLDDFYQEGRLLAELSERSAAILQARDVGMIATPDGHAMPYMVLEWLEGSSLESILIEERARGVPCRPLDQAVRLLAPVFEALALAHRAGIVHRDVKPDNVFVLDPKDGQARGVKLLDFGIAKVVQDVQKMGFGKTSGQITSFTPLYGAPEQFNRAYGATGPWTDVFALALVITAVVSGHEPLVGDTLVQLAHASCDPAIRPTPRRFGVPVSDAAEAVFLRALAVRCEDRFQDAGEFWIALSEVVFSGSVPRIGGGTGPGLPGPVIVPTGQTPIGLGASFSASAPTGLAPMSMSQSQPMSMGATGAPMLGATGAPMMMGATGAPMMGPQHMSATPMTAGAAPPPARSGWATVAVVGVGIALLALTGAMLYVRSPTGAARAGVPSATSPTPPTSITGASTPSASASAAAAPIKPCPEGAVRIPGGEFFMGSDKKAATDDEKPPHNVKLGSYCLDVYEVTVADYKACSDKGGCLRAGSENEFDDIDALTRKIYDPLCNIRAPDGKAKHPINCVDWNQARVYCEKQNGRLPTEAEWEFAALGPDGRTYPWGDEPPNARLLNACGTECVKWKKAKRDPYVPAPLYNADDGFVNTAPVGSFPEGRSKAGIHDVAGNVKEWVWDYYAPYDPDATKSFVDPKGPDSGEKRVVRGGAWNGEQSAWVRPSYRFAAPPNWRSYGIGFRCAYVP